MAARLASSVKSGRKSGARSSRAMRKRELFHFLIQKAKRRLKVHHHRRRSARGPAPSLMEQKRIESFEKWCAKVGLELHPKVSEMPHPLSWMAGIITAGMIGPYMQN